MRIKKWLVIIAVAFLFTFTNVYKVNAKSDEEFQQMVVDIFINNEYEDSLNQYNEILNGEEAKNDKRKEAFVYVGMGNIYDIKADFKNSLLCFNKALKIYEEFNEVDKLLELYGKVSRMTASARDYKAAVYYSNKLLSLGQRVFNEEINSTKEKDIEYANMITNVYITMATVCNEFKMEDKAGQYLKKANDLIIKYDLYIIEEFYYNAASYYYNKGDYEKSLEMANIAYERKIEIDIEQGTDYKDMAYMLIAKSEFALGKLDESEEHIDKASDLFNRVGDRLSNIRAYGIKGSIYATRGDYNKAIEYYEKSYELAKELELNQLIKDTSKSLITMYDVTDDGDNWDKYTDIYMETDEILENENEANVIFTMIDTLQIEQSNIMLENEKYMSTYKLSMVLTMAFVLLVILIFKIREGRISNVQAEQLRKALITDGLTGTYTREYVISQIEKNMLEEKQFSIAMIDIDDYKKVNDTYGHSVGDRVLKDLVKLTESIIGKGNVLGRYGGEEFIVLLNEPDIEQAFCIYENIRAIVQEIKFDNGSRITVSMGVKEYRGESLEELLIGSDRLLYKAKEKGKNRIEF